MDKELREACITVVLEVAMLMMVAISTERLERKDWDKVNKLFEIFAEEIKEGWEDKENVG